VIPLAAKRLWLATNWPQLATFSIELATRFCYYANETTGRFWKVLESIRHSLPAGKSIHIGGFADVQE
jgi:hypothetical protein